MCDQGLCLYAVAVIDESTHNRGIYVKVLIIFQGIGGSDAVFIGSVLHDHLQLVCGIYHESLFYYAVSAVVADKDSSLSLSLGGEQLH